MQVYVLSLLSTAQVQHVIRHLCADTYYGYRAEPSVPIRSNCPFLLASQFDFDPRIQACTVCFMARSGEGWQCACAGHLVLHLLLALLAGASLLSCAVRLQQQVCAEGAHSCAAHERSRCSE